mgnify:CR=1 FL=1
MTNMKNMAQNEPHLIPSLIASVMLFGALGNWPYEYFTLLRWVTCGAAIFVAYHVHDPERQWIAWLFGIIALLFNPIFPVYLSREIWAPIDVICGIAFLIIGFLKSNQLDDN